MLKYRGTSTVVIIDDTLVALLTRHKFCNHRRVLLVNRRFIWLPTADAVSILIDVVLRVLDGLLGGAKNLGQLNVCTTSVPVVPIFIGTVMLFLKKGVVVVDTTHRRMALPLLLVIIAVIGVDIHDSFVILTGVPLDLNAICVASSLDLRLTVRSAAEKDLLLL